MKFLKLDALSPRVKLIAGAAAGVFILGAMQFGVVFPLAKNIAVKDARLERLAKEVRAGEGRLLQKSEIDAEFSKFAGALGKPGSDSEAIGAMKEEIEELMAKTGLAGDPPLHREPRLPKDSEFGREYLVELLKLEASTEVLQNFLDELRNASGLYRVEKLTLAGGRNDSWSKGSMLISRLAMPPDEVKVAAAAAAAKTAAAEDAAKEAKKGKK
jgi:hypothetical protein